MLTPLLLPNTMALMPGEDDLKMRWNKRFKYPASQRSLIQGSRHYDIDQQMLPSVTTILSATQSEEKRQSLANWRARLGSGAADKVMSDAAARGTSMHTYLEAYIKGTGHMDLTKLGLQANTMAQRVIEAGLGAHGPDRSRP